MLRRKLTTWRQLPKLTKVVAIAASSRKAHKAGEEQATMKEDLTGEVVEVGDNTHELRDRFDTLTELKQQTNGMDR